MKYVSISKYALRYNKEGNETYLLDLKTLEDI